MSTQFQAEQGLIVVPAHLWGPLGDRVVRMALDTGATSTVLDRDILTNLGYDPAASTDRVRVTTGSRIERTTRVVVERMDALGRTQDSIPVVAHTLPPTTAVDGLIGLNYLRGLRLTIDFRRGSISLR